MFINCRFFQIQRHLMIQTSFNNDEFLLPTTYRSSLLCNIVYEISIMYWTGVRLHRMTIVNPRHVDQTHLNVLSLWRTQFPWRQRFPAGACIDGDAAYMLLRRHYSNLPRQWTFCSLDVHSWKKMNTCKRIYIYIV